MSDFRKENWMTNLPLYAISKLTELYHYLEPGLTLLAAELRGIID